jgi:CheY-like chemotaxis protein
LARLPAPPCLLVVDHAAKGAGAVEPIAGVQCPYLAMASFGAEAPPALVGRPSGVVTKPLKSAALRHAVIRLFRTGAVVDPAAPVRESLLSEEVPLRVLLAEDNAVNQKVALGLLERLGYRADLAANGLEALSLAEKQPYDLILMDLQMPEMDGLEACRQLRRRLPPARQPKVVAFTANAMEGDRNICLAAGMNDYISKPAMLDEIAAVIRRQFGRPDAGKEAS